MRCQRCLNTDPKYFYHGYRGTYCRRCIHLGGFQVEDMMEIDSTKPLSQLPFKLSKDQQRLSDQIAKYGFDNDVLVEAVCGAGKTECCLQLIDRALEKGLHVGWMIARRQVVLQLTERLQAIYSHHKVIAVCEGHTKDLQGQLILLTAHQLYRYPQAFDILIIDEPDAFPYKGNQLLHDLAQVACKNTKIYLSATPDETLLSLDMVHLKLHRRPHNRDLIVPKVIVTFRFFQRIILLLELIRLRKEKVLIFVPTIKQAMRTSKILQIPCITSKTPDKQTILEAFDSGQIKNLICTTILERGMTFEEVYVIVLDCHHPVYDEAALIQISGRVGRSFTKEKGECLFLSSRQSEKIDTCVHRLRMHNGA